jgi:membrane protease YdiL (CAAX protease family)
MIRDSAVIFVTGWTVFTLLSWLSRSLVSAAAAHQLLLKSLLVFASFALIAVSRRRVPGTYGFQRARGVPWGRTLITGVGLGASASLLILLLGGSGMQTALESMRFWQIVLIVWIGSSVSEEIFTRGWAQGALEPWRGVSYAGYSIPVITSAVLFGSMHATLFRRGVDAITTVVVLLATTLLGLIAGKLRERHHGIMPAITLHFCFNAGGAVGGALYVLTYRAITGRLPQIP